MLYLPTDQSIDQSNIHSKNPEFPYEKYGRFDFDNLDPTECKAECRFAKHDLLTLADALQIPEVI